MVGGIRQVAGHRELAASLERVTATARSPDGGVAVTVRPPGVLAGLALSDAALRRGAGELARTIVATAARAQAKLARRLASQAQRHLPGRYGLARPRALPAGQGR
jgi:glucose/arabinose dehydrogenase